MFKVLLPLLAYLPIPREKEKKLKFPSSEGSSKKERKGEVKL